MNPNMNIQVANSEEANWLLAYDFCMNTFDRPDPAKVAVYADKFGTRPAGFTL